MKEKKQYKSNLEQAQEYVKDNIWKRFWKYKLFELGIVPTAALAIWKIPTILGRGFINLFNIDITNQWGLGAMILTVIGGFVGLNWAIAKENVTDEARKKFDISYYPKI